MNTAFGEWLSLKIALAGVHVVSAIVSKDFNMGIGAWSWSQHRSGVCQITKWKRVGCEHKDKDGKMNVYFHLKKKQIKKNGRGKSFSDSEGKVLWPKVVAWVENLINIIYIIRVQQNLGQCLVGIWRLYIKEWWSAKDLSWITLQWKEIMNQGWSLGGFNTI